MKGFHAQCTPPLISSPISQLLLKGSRLREGGFGGVTYRPCVSQADRWALSVPCHCNIPFNAEFLSETCLAVLKGATEKNIWLLVY